MVVIAQIEHIDGVNNLEAIIDTPGIDGTFIGPYDLSGSLGIPGQYNEPVVIEALKKVERICAEKNVSMGYHVIEPDIELVKAKQAAGYNFIAFSTDFLFMGRTAFAEMQKNK
jgi:2-dehydro-3-deoxyglucarate aldolase